MVQQLRLNPCSNGIDLDQTLSLNNNKNIMKS